MNSTELHQLQPDSPLLSPLSQPDKDYLGQEAQGVTF